MDPPAQLLAFAPQSETALLDFARSRVTGEMIHKICLQDWKRDVEIHEAALLRQLEPHPELGLLGWHPREVLELERWEEPDEGDAEHPPSGIPGHYSRLLACTILLRNVAHVSIENRDGECEFFIAISAATIRQLLRSAIALGTETVKPTLGFLLWLHEKERHPIIRPFSSFAVLLLQANSSADGKDLLDICKWVEADERLARSQLEEAEEIDAMWLVGLNYQEATGEPRQLWAETLERVISRRAGKFPSDVDSVLRGLHERLSLK